jgi:hypothetical protein
MTSTIDRRRGLLDEIPTDIAADMDAWAYWMKQHGDGLGFASTSVAWRLMKAKEVGIAARGTSVDPEMPETVAQVNEGVEKLNRKEKKAFHVYYLHYARAVDKAKTCHCDVGEFYRRVKRARRTVADVVRMLKSRH